jgi:hypothetical protein
MARLLSIALSVAFVAAAQTTDLRGINTHYDFKPFASKSDWETRRAQLQLQILSSAGLVPMPPKTPLHPRTVKQSKTNMAVVETLLLETLPGFFVGANLYKPLQPAAKMPAVLVPHGHWANGRVENLPEYSVPALAMNLARQGYVVLTLDMVGYNDTKQVEHKFGGREEELWSYTPLGLQLWNGIRALDYLQSLPDVDSNRIAATGASGGGTQTFLLAAVDDRVKFAAPVNMISAYMQGGCVCEGAPGLRVDTFNVELAAIVAPRPMLMVSCTGDWTQHTPKEEFPAMQKMYELYDEKTRVENAHINAKHNYNAESRAAVYRFLAKHLQPALREEELAEQPIGNDWRAADLLAGATPSTPSAAELFAAWKAMSRQQSKATTDLSVLRNRMREVFHLDHKSETPRQWLWKAGVGDPMLVVYSGAAEAAAELFRTERPLLLVPAYRHARPEAAMERSFHTYNLSESVLQVHDIVRALDSLKEKGTVEIVPVGDMVLPALFAAALSSTPSNVRSANLPGAGDSIPDSFFVPGIERAGGIEVALRLNAKKGSR